MLFEDEASVLPNGNLHADGAAHVHDFVVGNEVVDADAFAATFDFFFGVIER